MLKNLSLSVKMAIGFGSLIVIASVLGFFGWKGLSEVSGTNTLVANGNTCLGSLNELRVERRAFQVQGFTKDKNDKTAVDRWNDAYATMVADLEKLKGEKLDADAREAVEASLVSAAEYKSVFGEMTKAYQQRQDAFEAWKKLGWDITAQITDIRAKTVTPAIEKALKSNNAGQLREWYAISDRLHADVFETFLVLRVSAVYLLATNKDEQWETYTTNLKKTKDNLDGWRSLVKGKPELVATADKIASLLGDYESAGNDYHSGMMKEREVEQKMVASATAIVASIDKLEKSFAHTLDGTITRSNRLAVFLAVACIIIGTLLAVFITRSVVGPINRVIAGLGDGSKQVSSASGQVAESSQHMAEGASEQAASLEETSSSLEQMASMTRQNADNASQVSSMATEVRNLAEKSGDAMTRMAEAIARIKSSSDETAKIIKTIDEIAFQTNLLALNAAVEAARAGEAGKGFAVVAEEVRNLAQRSAEAAKSTASLIEESQKNSENGVSVSSEVGEIIKQITGGVGKMAQLVSEVSAASNEQAQGIEQINTAVAQMDKVTQSNAANAEESASASEELSAQAKELNEFVEVLNQTIKGGAAAQVSQSSRLAADIDAGHRDGSGLRDKIHHMIVDRKPTAPARAVRTAKPKEPVLAGAGAPAKRGGMRPEQVIPLDDNELKNF